jgi:aminoglycoside phosphotransferase (APT) family kinase protein
MSQTLPPLVDEVALANYLERQMSGNSAPLSATRVGDGHSNETFLIRWGDEEMILRRPPRGPLLPTAHDVKREYTFISALYGTALPVPKPILMCEDSGVIGAPFYLMDYLPGVIINRSMPEGFDTVAERRNVADQTIQTLAILHSIDYNAVGLGNVGKPTGYLERQLKRWSDQLARTLPHTRPLPMLEKVGEWLRANMPDSPPATIVHGDFRIDNMIFAPQPPAQVIGVLDWEMATIGDPLADLGYLLSFWSEATDPVGGSVLSVSSLTRLEGFPTRHEVVERYAELTGRKLPAINFYIALAIWKLAVLSEGSYARHLAGTTDDPIFAKYDKHIPELAERAWRVCNGGY